MDFLNALVGAVGADNVITDAAVMQPFLEDWRGVRLGVALAVVRPASTAEVVKVVMLCQNYHIAIVPQGGNTGLVLASTPPDTAIPSKKAAIVLSLQRMRAIGEVDTLNNSVEVEAGAVLQHIQEAAQEANRLFPLGLAAQGSCTIGGNLATNAGGVQVLRYGSARHLCLGLEAVLANGSIYNGSYHLHKNNSGYAIRDLLIGSEGSLGIITKAVLKVFAATPAKAVALVFVDTMPQALQLWSAAQSLAVFLTAFELMQMQCIDLVAKYFAPLGENLQRTQRFAVLIELSHSADEAYLQQQLMDFLEAQMAAGTVQDAVLAQSKEQEKILWTVRERIPLAEAKAVKAQDFQMLKHDISLPVSQMATFIAAMESHISQECAAAKPFYFGHCGDGNLHYNVILPRGVVTQISTLIYDKVVQLGGSFSAEHGIGRLRLETLKHYRSAHELEVMRSVKQALDPNNILNPGVMVDV